MRQSGHLAAAGLIALNTIVPCLREDHARTKDIANAIHQIRSPNFHVDLTNVHSNILLIQINSDRITANDFCERLQSISKQEILDGVKTNSNQGILVKASARDWSYTRVVVYHQITGSDVEYAIKKLTYVIKEIDRKLFNK